MSKKGKEPNREFSLVGQSTDILEMQGKILKCTQSRMYYKSKAVP